MSFTFCLVPPRPIQVGWKFILQWGSCHHNHFRRFSQTNSTSRNFFVRNKASSASGATTVLVGFFGGYLYSSKYQPTTTIPAPATTSCEASPTQLRLLSDANEGIHVHWDQSTIWQKLQRCWRLVKRCLQLGWNLAPIVIFYPVFVWSGSPDAEESNCIADAQEIVLMQDDSQLEDGTGIRRWYLALCLRCVERSGAAVIKLMQWAGSRPDLFGHEFCGVFSRLQDDTTPHSWRYTKRLLREAYGDDWKDKIELGEILGSGCIGQVYRGRVKPATNGLESDDKQPFQDVAVKVLHPHVHEDIDADLDIMRVAVRAIQVVPFADGIFSTLRWLNLEGVVEEFAGLLKLQIDLRREAENLIRFNENFKDDKTVVFPKLVPGFEPTENVLVETFCDGIPVIQFCRQNQEMRKMLTEMCREAIRAVCKMIFLDNFMHGDLHPGNVFVSPDGKKFILFDVGIVNEYAEHDHNAIIDILGAFIRQNGRLAGRHMIDDSNSRLLAAGNMDVRARNEEKFLDKIEYLTIRANQKGYLMENLGSYISYICDAAAQHHVMMNPAFVSAALAVKIQEGIALGTIHGFFLKKNHDDNWR